MPTHKEFIHQHLERLADDWELPHKKTIKLKKALTDRLLVPPPEVGVDSHEQFMTDLRDNNPLLARGVAAALRVMTGTRAAPTDFAFRFEFGEEHLRVETDLAERFALDDMTEHKVVEKGLLAVAALNERLESMKRHEAMTGFREGDLPLFEDRLWFQARQLDPSVQEERFQRVLTITGLPEVGSDVGPGAVDAARLVEVLQTDECREFRQWLREVDSATDAEIEQRFRRLRELIGTAVHSRTGKAVRFATSTGIGFVPVVGQVAGPLAGALDMFLAEKIVPGRGPTAFLSQLYPSIFPQADEHGSAGP